MNAQRLCPVYRKWLQLNPSSAYQRRIALQARTTCAPAGKVVAILPLYATSPSSCRLITPIQHSLDQSWHSNALSHSSELTLH